MRRLANPETPPILDVDQGVVVAFIFGVTAGEFLMSDDPSDVIMAAIRSSFVSYPREGDPDWRGPSWIMPEECEHLTKVVMRELKANGFEIVKNKSNAPS